MEGSHDEDNWPTEIGVIEIEERWRLFWCIYTLDVFTSIVWGGVIRSREAQSNFSYPFEVDDDMFDDNGLPKGGPSAATSSYGHGLSGAHGTSWVAGRNFVIDLYRTIERLVLQSQLARALRGRYWLTSVSDAKLLSHKNKYKIA